MLSPSDEQLSSVVADGTFLVNFLKTLASRAEVLSLLGATFSLRVSFCICRRQNSAMSGLTRVATHLGLVDRFAEALPYLPTHLHRVFKHEVSSPHLYKAMVAEVEVCFAALLARSGLTGAEIAALQRHERGDRQVDSRRGAGAAARRHAAAHSARHRLFRARPRGAALLARARRRSGRALGRVRRSRACLLAADVSSSFSTKATKEVFDGANHMFRGAHAKPFEQRVVKFVNEVL